MPDTSTSPVHLDRVFLGLPATGLDEIFQVVARSLEPEAGGRREAILAALHERERTQTTAWGGGIAVPHARVPGLLRSFVAFVRPAAPIASGASDGRPIDLLLVALSAAEDPGEHVRLLARLARRLRVPGATEALRAARDSSDVRAVLEAE